MKIAFIIRKLNVKGGTQRQMLCLANELQRRGHGITVYALAYSKKDCYTDLLENITVVELPKEIQDSFSEYYVDIRFLKPLTDFLRENRLARELAMQIDHDVDLLNPHDQVSYRVAYYYKKYVKNIPSVWNMNDLPLFRWGYDRMRGCDDAFWQPLYKRLLYWAHDWFDNWKFISAQNEIVVVDFFNRGLVQNYLGRKALTVRNGPDFEHFVYKKRTLPKGKVRLLTSGIFMPHRRYEDAIHALKILRDRKYDVSLTILGNSENDKKYYEKLKNLVSSLRVNDHVFFAGKVSEQELIQAYQTHDIYTFQHHLQSDGLSPFEAAACGMPIIVSKTAGCHEVLADHTNALFIEPKNPEDFAVRAQELLDDPALYEKIAENGATFVRGHFSWKKYADSMLSIFQNILTPSSDR